MLCVTSWRAALLAGSSSQFDAFDERRKYVNMQFLEASEFREKNLGLLTLSASCYS
jgi:hypothetical protein